MFMSQHSDFWVGARYRRLGSEILVSRIVGFVVLVVRYREMLTGYLEEREALRWVQKHISAFGGDPSKVTM